MNGVEIIENTETAMNKYGHFYGSSTLELTLEQFNAIKDGKCIACNDGEYSTFIVLEKSNELDKKGN